MRTPTGGLEHIELQEWWIAGHALALCMPDWLPRIDAEEGVVSYTMFEATKLPEGWAEEINRFAQALIVPCAWNAEVFRENGVTRADPRGEVGRGWGRMADEPVDGGRQGDHTGSPLHVFVVGDAGPAEGV